MKWSCFGEDDFTADLEQEIVVIFFTLDFASCRMYENRQHCTVVAINNLGFSAESAGRGCNSAVCTVDIQLWAS